MPPSVRIPGAPTACGSPSSSSRDKGEVFNNVRLSPFTKTRFSIVGVFNRITQEAPAISISSLHLPPSQILMHGGGRVKAEGG